MPLTGSWCTKCLSTQNTNKKYQCLNTLNMFFSKKKKKSSELVGIFLKGLQMETEVDYREITTTLNYRCKNLVSQNDNGLMNLVYARIALQNQNVYQNFNREEFENIHQWLSLFILHNEGEYALNQLKKYTNIFVNASKIMVAAGPIAVADAILKDWIDMDSNSCINKDVIDKVIYAELINITKVGMLNYRTNWDDLKNKYVIKYDNLP